MIGAILLLSFPCDLKKKKFYLLWIARLLVVRQSWKVCVFSTFWDSRSMYTLQRYCNEKSISKIMSLSCQKWTVIIFSKDLTLFIQCECEKRTRDRMKGQNKCFERRLTSSHYPTDIPSIFQIIVTLFHIRASTLLPFTSL